MTEQRKRGRPTSDDEATFAALMKNEETRQDFKEKLENLIYLRKRLNEEQEVFAEDVSAVAESTGMSKGWINKWVGSKAKGKEKDLATQGALFAEALELMYNDEDGDE